MNTEGGGHARDEAEDALPEVLALRPEVGGLGEPDGDEGAADGEGDEEPREGAKEDLRGRGVSEQGGRTAS